MWYQWTICEKMTKDLGHVLFWGPKLPLNWAFGDHIPHTTKISSNEYTAHKKFMNTSTSAESIASFILEGRYLENQTPQAVEILHDFIPYGPLISTRNFANPIHAKIGAATIMQEATPKVGNLLSKCVPPKWDSILTKRIYGLSHKFSRSINVLSTTFCFSSNCV